MTQNAMTETQEETLTFEVSDEALEIAASGSSGQMNFTLAACTGLSACPANLSGGPKVPLARLRDGYPLGL